MTSEKLLNSRAGILYAGFILVYPLLMAFSLMHLFYDHFVAEKKCKNIAGEVAVVTGGARGLGKCIAEELAAKGCHVAIVDVLIEKAEETAKAIRDKYKVKAKAYKVDVTKYEEVVALNAQVTQDIGLATILINNAGILLLSNYRRRSPQEVQKMISVNYMSHFLTNQVFLENMKQAKKGHIVAISSISGLFHLVYSEPYCSTKHAVRAYMRVLRSELMYEDHNYINTTVVYPTFLQTHPEVAKAAKNMGFTDFYPLISGEKVARRTVLAIMRNEAEVAEPSFFLLLSRLIYFLPGKMHDLVPLLRAKLRKIIKNNK